MSTQSRPLALGVTALCLVSLPAMAKPLNHAKHPPAVVRTAAITNSGSTNTAGYEIVVSSDGGARYNGHPSRVRSAMAARFFHDLDAAAPLPALKVRHGIRSVSFGTMTYISYKNQRTPDLTFGGDAHASALKADVDVITQALRAGNEPRPLVH